MRYLLNKRCEFGVAVLGAAALAALLSAGCGGNDRSSANPGSEDKTQTAKFSVKTAADPVEGGVIDRDPDSAYYAPNSEVTLSALVNPGYKFLGWEGDTALAAGKTLFTCRVTGDLTFTAKFQKMPQVTIATTDGGSVSIYPNRDYYGNGDKVTLTAAADAGYEFARWLDGKGAPLNSNNPYIITIGDTDVKLTAEFQPL